MRYFSPEGVVVKVAGAFSSHRPTPAGSLGSFRCAGGGGTGGWEHPMTTTSRLSPTTRSNICRIMEHRDRSRRRNVESVVEAAAAIRATARPTHVRRGGGTEHIQKAKPGRRAAM